MIGETNFFRESTEDEDEEVFKEDRPIRGRRGPQIRYPDKRGLAGGTKAEILEGIEKYNKNPFKKVLAERTLARENQNRIAEAKRKFLKILAFEIELEKAYTIDDLEAKFDLRWGEGLGALLTANCDFRIKPGGSPVRQRNTIQIISLKEESPALKLKKTYPLKIIGWLENQGPMTKKRLQTSTHIEKQIFGLLLDELLQQGKIQVKTENGEVMALFPKPDNELPRGKPRGIEGH